MKKNWLKKNWWFLLLGGIIMTAVTGGIIKFVLPYLGKFKITSNYGYRVHPITKVKKFHNGIDISMPVGTFLTAPADGEVVYVGKNETGGNQLKIKHSEISTGYAHLSEVLVKVGQKIKQGELIAKSGNTGQSTGPHLHFTVRKNKPNNQEGDIVNPTLYFNFS